MASFESKLLKWYYLNKRDLPWREEPKPYNVWISEIVLQQTRVDQGISYYNRFIEAFPDLESLNKVGEQKVLKLWQGLGYYSRARNLKKAAAYCFEKNKGKLPANFSDWLKLPGVGEYTAAAISSICYNEKVPVLDGNVYRVMSRYLACELPVDEIKNKNFYRSAVFSQMKRGHFGDFNQALMELGATVCSPRNPNCNDCPLSNDCIAFKRKNFHDFPVKKLKTKVKSLYLNYAFSESADEIIIIKRKQNSFWKNLYEFPLIEKEKKLSTSEKVKVWNTVFGKNNWRQNKLAFTLKHQLSHRNLFVNIDHFILEEKVKVKGGRWVKKKEVHKFPFPKPIALYLERKGL